MERTALSVNGIAASAVTIVSTTKNTNIVVNNLFQLTRFNFSTNSKLPSPHNRLCTHLTKQQSQQVLL